MSKIALKKSQSPVKPEPATVRPDLEKEATEELTAAMLAFRADRKAELNRFAEQGDSEYWCALCFETRAQKEEFLSKIGVLSEGDKYLDGLKVAAALGIKIESPGIPTIKLKISKRWQTLIRE